MVKEMYRNSFPKKIKQPTLFLVQVLICSVILQSTCFAFVESDINKDNFVNFEDLSCIAHNWLNNNADELSYMSHVTFAATQKSLSSEDSSRIVFVDDFNSAAKWKSVVGSICDSSVNSVFHDKSMKVTGGTHSSYPIIMYSDVNNLNFNTCTFRLRYYVQSNAGLRRDSSSVWPLMVYFDASKNLSKYAQVTYIPVEQNVWHDVVWTSSEVIAGGGFNFATDTIKRIWVRCAGNTANIIERPIIYFDKFEVFRNAPNRPGGVIIGLDDGWDKLPDSQYEALLYATQKGVRVYCALNTQMVGVSPDYMTWDQVAELYSTGLVNMHAHYSVPPYGRGEEALREYLIKSKQDLLDHGISESDAEVFVMPSGTDGAAPNYIPTVNDILILKDYFRIIRGTGGFWTGAGYINEIGSSRTRSYISYDRPQRWWTYACGLSHVYVADIEDKLVRAKEHYTILSIYAHLGVTHDITLEEWKTVIDAIAAAQERGDIVVYSLNTIG